MSQDKNGTSTDEDQNLDPREALRAYLSEQGLKSTRQRDLIVDVFFASEEHLRVDELLSRVRAIDPKVSQATVYRTIRLLKESGLAQERHFGDGQARYEPSAQDEDHHDHLICVECGKIVEFVDTRIEKLQEEVAGEYGFAVVKHKMELYGICEECS
ncbi:MAG: transcriptional repressor [Deltaproteobacteria bacterium]|nr:transcriptional repressor [Deltaproteobacteria bacterium]